MDAKYEVQLLGMFGLLVSGRLVRGLPLGSKHLLALLALRDRALSRDAVAGTLWPEASESHAHASLRSTLTRLNGVRRQVIRVTTHELELADDIVIDVRNARMSAHRLLSAESDEADLSPSSVAGLTLELLPTWTDDWAIAEAEEWRQLRLHALDALAEKLLIRGRIAEAVDAAEAAVASEPLRETAHAVLIRIHLADGNMAAALEAYQRYETLLQAELGLAPTNLLKSLIEAKVKLDPR